MLRHLNAHLCMSILAVVCVWQHVGPNESIRNRLRLALHDQIVFSLSVFAQDSSNDLIYRVGKNSKPLLIYQ